mgnify:FL=1
MAESTRKRRPTSTETQASQGVVSTSSQSKPSSDEHTVETIFSWLHTVDDWAIAGHQNKLPRWVYVLLVVYFILS